MGAGASQEAFQSGREDALPQVPSQRPTLGQRPTHTGDIPPVTIPPPTDSSTIGFPTRQMYMVPPRYMPGETVPAPPIVQQAPVRTTSVVKNDINLKKNTLKLVQSAEDESVYLVEFEFDAKVDGFVTVYFAATQDIKLNVLGDGGPIEKITFSGLHEKRPSKTMFSAGSNQRYSQKLEKGLDIRKFSSSDLTFRERVKRYPVVIRLEAVFPEDYSTPEDTRVRAQYTFADIKSNLKGGYSCKVLRQEVFVGGTIYAVMELYGMAGEVTASRFISESSSADESGVGESSTSGKQEYTIDQGHECVICLTEACTTAVMPCYHLCLCDACGRHLGSDSTLDRRRCPICRTAIRGLVPIISKGAVEGDQVIIDYNVIEERRTGDLI